MGFLNFFKYYHNVKNKIVFYFLFLMFSFALTMLGFFYFFSGYEQAIILATVASILFIFTTVQLYKITEESVKNNYVLLKLMMEIKASVQENSTNKTKMKEASLKEIVKVTSTITQIMMSLEELEGYVGETQVLADTTIPISKKSTNMVKESVVGMQKIRQQIQETAKRIKRLGESSQEIGSMVSLMDDIADQTNILALNATIQAAMAGDAGRGFAVIAEEVQRLAERASQATKQIASLVNVIQTDTYETVVSIEQTATEVVGGVHLAQEVALVLEKMEVVSNDLVTHLQKIVHISGKQLSLSSHVSETMTRINDLTIGAIEDFSSTTGRINQSIEGFALYNGQQ